MINGDEVEVRRGDKVVTLDERLEMLDAELRALKRLMYIFGVIMLVHLLMPNLDLIAYIISALGG